MGNLERRKMRFLQGGPLLLLGLEVLVLLRVLITPLLVQCLYLACSPSLFLVLHYQDELDEIMLFLSLVT
jgi:hypothetical protein